MSLKNLLVFLNGFALFLLSVEPRYRIQTNTRLIKWNGCLLKKYSILPSDKTNCSECAANSTYFVKSKETDKQRYKNCSLECGRPTVCTDYKYHIEGVWRSECYQCEHSNDEIITYNLIRGYEICSEECKQCAKDADLSTAPYCAFKCKGHPTFCYPPQMWFGYQLCYRSPKLYGCHFLRVNPKSISEECLVCAKQAKIEEAQECASDCEGMPTFHIGNVDEVAAADHEFKFKYYQCQLDLYGPVMFYDYPQYIMKFIKIGSEKEVSSRTDYQIFTKHHESYTGALVKIKTFNDSSRFLNSP